MKEEMMAALDITLQERRAGRLSAERLAEAVRAVREDGYVLLNDLIDPAILAPIRDRMLADVEKILARDDVPFNFNSGNIQQDPPPFPPYLSREVLCNEIVISITQSILGKGLVNGMYSGNTALPHSTGRQPVHADMGQLWPNLDVAHPAYALVINVLPVDVSPANGSTEIWPGTHLDTSVVIQEGDIKVSPEKLAERRQVSPGFQYSARAGSVVIRDMRMWHAGMPNPSDQPRPMIAMIHYVSWWTDLHPLEFAAGSEPYLAHPVLRHHVRYVEGEPDHTRRNKAYDFMK
jgi:ectoine hydroxylase-related dioxygenase (phytanoyl-CoA dioxygenase family)